MVGLLRNQLEVYLDESGDLGFSHSSSRYFLIVALVTVDSSELGRIIRRARRRFSNVYKIGGEFKFNRSGDALRRFVIESIAGTQCQIYLGAVDKFNTMPRMRLSKDEMWKEVAISVLSEVSWRTRSKSIQVILDRRPMKAGPRAALDACLKGAVSNCYVGYVPPIVSVSHFDSARTEGLQVADHVAGALFQSIERGNHGFYHLLEKRIISGGMLR